MKLKLSDLRKMKDEGMCFATPETQDDLRVAELKLNKKSRTFDIWFNGKLFSFKTIKGAENKLNKLIYDWNLERTYTYN